MHQIASNDVIEHETPISRAFAATASLGAATVTLGRVGWRLADAVTLDARVAVAVLALGVLAGSVLTIGTGLLVVAAAARSAGHTLRVVELASTRLTPRLLRRVLVVGLGAGLAGLGGPALADSPPDLGWQVTDQVLAAPVPTASGPTAGSTSSAVLAALASSQARTPASAPVSTPAPTPAPAPTHASAPSPDTVVVRRGDCLWTIAAAHLPPGASDAEIAAAWPRWYLANRTTIGSDPDLILPGQRLAVPDEAAS
jgi:nucleoid-associated protein YgaU